MDNRIDSQEKALALKCLEFAKAEGASAARVTLNKSVMDLVGTLNGEIDKVSHCLDRSISLSLFVSGRYGTYSTNNICEDSLKDFVAKAVKTTSIFAEDSCRRLPDPSRKAKDAGRGDELGLYDAEYEAVTPESRIGRALEASIYNELKPVSEEAEYSDCLYDTLVVDTDGLECRHTETSFEYGVEMTVSDGNGNKFSSFWWDASTFLKDFNLKGCARKAYNDAVAQFNPKPVESGKYNAVILSKVASKVVSPILNALGGYAIQQNNSFLLGRLGEKVFSEGFTIVDECRSVGLTGSRLFDSEGVATKVHPVIEKGAIKEYFINTYMSRKLGMEPTVEDITRARILPFPKPGMDHVDIMGLCGDGILITDFNGGNSNTATGDFSYGFSGFLFKDGKIVHPVREMVMTGNFISLWNNLIAAGEDARPCFSKLIPTLAFSNVDISA